jgi:antitoxin PrlF
VKARIDSRGRATIPKEIREHLGLKPGNRVKFFIHPDGHVVILPTIPVSALRGMLKTKRRQPVTIEEMNNAIVAGATAGWRRRERR